MSRKSGYAGRSAAAVLVVLVVATAVGRAMALKGAQVPEAPPTATGAGDLLQLTGRLLYREGPTANTAELHVSLPRGNHTRAATPPRASGGDATTTIVDATGAVQQLGAGNSGSRVDGADDIGGGSDADGGDSDSSGVASGGDAVKVYYLPEDDFWYLKSYYRSMSVISLLCQLKPGSTDTCASIDNTDEDPANIDLATTNRTFSLLVMISSWLGDPNDPTANCRQPAGTTPGAVAKAFGGAGGLAQQFDECSYGSMKMDVQALTTIFTPINCRADYAGLDESYMDEMMDRALEVAVENLGFDRVAAFTRHVLLMPDGVYVNSTWRGAAVTPGWWTFQMPQFISTPAVAMHELLHTWGLYHGWGYDITPWLGAQEYMDGSDVMAAGATCPSAPQLWRLGWGTPVATLYGNDLPVGQVLSYTLPAVYSTPSSFLRIVVDWMDGPRSLLTSSSQLDRTLYLSFKTPAGGDALLDQSPFESTREMLATAAVQLYGNRLSVHQGWSDAEARARGMYDKELGDPQYVIADALPPGSDQDYKALKLKVAVKDIHQQQDGSSAAPTLDIALCRYDTDESECQL